MGAQGATGGLAGYVVKRLLGMLLLLAGVTFVVFGMMYLAPGDVTVMLAASSPSPEQVAAIRREFGLDQPPWVQYGRFLQRVVQGDLGDSWIDRRPVMPQVLDAFAYTLRLAAVALALSVALGTAGGIVAAVRHRSVTDESILTVTLLGISVPVFVTGLLLIYLRVAPQVVAVPALGIFLSVLAFNFLGDALRDHLDPARAGQRDPAGPALDGRRRGRRPHPRPTGASMPSLPTIYTARSDVDAAHLARVEDWYAERHAPDLIRAGFYTAQVYYSEVGTPLICNLYEIPGPGLFQTQAYRDVAAKDTDGPAVIALLSSRSNTIYDQVLTVNVPEGAPTGRREDGLAV